MKFRSERRWVRLQSNGDVYPFDAAISRLARTAVSSRRAELFPRARSPDLDVGPRRMSRAARLGRLARVQWVRDARGK
jgi:hypothetical protein